MAITKKAKQPRGYEVQGIKYLELSEGVQPPLEAIAAPYLPVIEEDKLMETWFVIEAGQIVAFDMTALNSETKQVTNKKWLVQANGGAAQVVTYAANDVGEVIGIDSYNTGDPAAVAAAGAATKNIAANIPAGFAPYKFYTSAAEKIYHNFKLQHAVGFVTDYFIEVPLIYDTGATSTVQSTLETGHLVKPSTKGYPIKWVNGTDSVEQICGRCVRTDAIAVKDALDKVLVVPGLKLPGTGTSGKQLHEDVSLSGTSTKVTRKAKINITLL